MLQKIIFSIFVASIISCAPIQNRTQDVETNSPAEIEAKKILGEKMVEDGYLPGRISYSDLRDDCQYTIQLKDGEKTFYYVDPINLDEKYNTDGQTIWVKFTESEAEKRCEKADPIEIIEILNRDE